MAKWLNDHKLTLNLEKTKCMLIGSNKKLQRKIALTVSIFDHCISNGNRTEWSPIQSVIIRVITKSDDRAAGVRFVYHEYDYRLNWTTRSLIIN